MLLFDALIERGTNAAESSDGIPQLYEPKTIKHVVEIAQDGRYLGYEQVTLSTAIPAQARSSGKVARIVDDFSYTLGAGRSNKSVEFVRECHELYLAQLEQLAAELTGSPRAAVDAIRLFLVNTDRPCFIVLGAVPTPAQLEVLSGSSAKMYQGKKLGALVVRGALTSDPEVLQACSFTLAASRAICPSGLEQLVSGDATDPVVIKVRGCGDWWLDPQMQVAHQGRARARSGVQVKESKGKGKAGASSIVVEFVCSICARSDRPQARLFGGVPMGADKPCLVSFNNDKWRAYKFEQGANAPTCQECAEAMVRGLADILKVDARPMTFGVDTRGLFWGSAAGPKAQWSAFEALFSGEDPSVQLVDGHFAVVSWMKKRIALRRYGEVVAAEVLERVGRWRRHLGRREPWQVAQAICRVKPNTRVPASALGQLSVIVEALHYYLILGEPLPGYISAKAKSALDHGESALKHTLRAWLNLVDELNGQPLLEVEVDLENSELDINEYGTAGCDISAFTPAQAAAWWVGRAFKVAAYCQWIKTRAKRGIETVAVRRAERDLAVAEHVIRRFAVGRSGLLREAAAYLRYANEVLNGAPFGHVLPGNVRYFSAGVLVQERLYEARRLKKAAEEAAEAEAAAAAAVETPPAK